MDLRQNLSFCTTVSVILNNLTPLSLSLCTSIIGIIYCLFNIHLRNDLIFANTVNPGVTSMNKTKTLVMAELT